MALCAFGARLIDFVDAQLGMNGWKLQHPSKKVADLTKQGHENCHTQRPVSIENSVGV